MPADSWNPDQYNKFRDQRMQPFYDLTALIPSSRNSRHLSAIDLGCGTGELTAMLADLLSLDRIEGIDSSAAMLEKAKPRASDRVKFRLLEMTEVSNFSSYDLIFSNAAFHWIQDNEKFLNRTLKQMKHGAQIAVQLPKNDNHPSHSIAAEIALQKPFRDLFKGFVHRSGALGLERYAPHPNLGVTGQGILNLSGLSGSLCVLPQSAGSAGAPTKSVKGRG
jgi:trans-aconitate 2-methyltransferase